MEKEQTVKKLQEHLHSVSQYFSPLECNLTPLENLVFADLQWSNASPCGSDVEGYSWYL